MTRPSALTEKANPPDGSRSSQNFPSRESIAISARRPPFGKPAKMRGMGEDVNLVALDHRAARDGLLRRPVPVEALQKHSSPRVEAGRRPERKRFCGDPVAVSHGADARRRQSYG
jgi:hypothetical protein